jgi:hypothetical protein
MLKADGVRRAAIDPHRFRSNMNSLNPYTRETRLTSSGTKPSILDPNASASGTGAYSMSSAAARYFLPAAAASLMAFRCGRERSSS